MPPNHGQGPRSVDYDPRSKYPPRFYDPDNGFGSAFLGVAFAGVAVWFWLSGDDLGTRALGTAWAGCCSITGIVVGVVRFRTWRRTGGKWPETSASPEQLPIEPFRNMSDQHSPGAYLREPALMFVLGAGMMVFGVAGLFVGGWSDGAGWVLFLIALGAIPTGAGVIRWRWMRKFTKAVGHPPW